LLLGYIILDGSKEKMGHERTKATIEAMRNKEMGSYKTSRIFTLPQTTLQGYVKD
jgi:hypothetical protein